MFLNLFLLKSENTSLRIQMFLCLPPRATFVVDTDQEFVSEPQKMFPQQMFPRLLAQVCIMNNESLFATALTQ